MSANPYQPPQESEAPPSKSVRRQRSTVIDLLFVLVGLTACGLLAWHVAMEVLDLP